MNLTRYVLDSAGEPVPEPDLLVWAQWMGTGDNHAIARSYCGRYFVSTIFLGLDANWIGGPLTLFETRVHGGKLDSEYERYTSKEDALAGHARMVQRVGESA